MKQIYNTDALCHYGIPGMKWGVHRNPKQLAAARNEIKKEKDRKFFNKMGAARGITKNTEDLTRSASNVVDSASRIRDAKRNSNSKAKRMSDQELRNAINRMNMEKTYNSLVNERNTSRGATYAKEALGIIGSTVAFTGAVLGIATSIKQLKG